MRQRAARNGITNLFVLDGILESIQLPDNSLDMLFTSNSIGWNIEKELQEIERVVKRNG
jgi:ubiquinone/menaquinone biosynthesis C-methylase UbiE